MRNAALSLMAALGVLAPELRAQASRLDPFDYMVMHTAGNAARLPFRARAHDVEIDQSLIVDWDELRFFAATSSRSRPPELVDRVEGRIAFLSDAIAGFVQAQAALVEVRTRTVALNAARRLDGPNVRVLSDSLIAARGRFSAVARQSIAQITSADTNPAFADARPDAARLRAAVNEALLDPSGDYTPVGRVLESSLGELAETLGERAATGDSVLVYMTAWLYSGGERRQLHLAGYDDFSVSDPLPFPRVRFSVDERTRRELESAEAMARRLQNLDGLKTQVQAAVNAFRSAVDTLGKSLKGLDGELELLAGELQRLTLGPELPQSVAWARQSLEAVLRFTPPQDTGGSDAAILIAFAGKFDAAVTSLETAASALTGRFSTLETDLRAQAPALIQTRAAAVANQLRAIAGSLVDSPEIKAVFAELRAIGTQLGVTQRVLAGVGVVGEMGRQSSPDTSLDTSLDLLTAGERHPGDYVVLTVRVQQVEPRGTRRTLAEQRQSFRLRVLGFYLEPRGALLFADPRKAELSNQSFEPVVALSYVGHVGFRNFGFWNDVINPGLGVTFTLLDFDDDTDLEFGVGGTVTILRDLLLVGFGRNIPVKANFFYVGVNPLAFGDLLRLSRGGAGSDR